VPIFALEYGANEKGFTFRGFLQFVGNTDVSFNAAEGLLVFPMEAFWVHQEHLPALRGRRMPVSVSGELQEEK